MPFCKVNDIKLYYEDYGAEDENPLVFIHGGFVRMHKDINGSKMWKPYVDRFKGKRRVIVFDLRGFGQSDKPRGEYSIRQFSEDLFSLMKNLNVKKAIVAGESLGGMIALKFALDHQEMVEKLVLISTTATKLSFVIRMLMPIYARIIILRKKFPETLAAPRHVIISMFSAVRKFDIKSELFKIQVPTLIIHGSNDKWIALSQVEYLKEHILNSEMVVLQGSGHALTIETPEKTCETLEKFLSN